MVNRIRSKSGRFIALIPAAPAEGFSVVATALGITHFNSRWPCSRLRESPVRFEFAGNGDLVDVVGKQPDGEDLLALSHDAQEFGEKCKRRLGSPKPG
jgi:hypothetical protein